MIRRDRTCVNTLSAESHQPDPVVRTPAVNWTATSLAASRRFGLRSSASMVQGDIGDKHISIPSTLISSRLIFGLRTGKGNDHEEAASKLSPNRM
jgi:hypothetical protein